MNRIACGHAQRERIRFGESDIFYRHADDASSNIERIFPSLEHSGEPVERSIGIAVANRLVKRGNNGVMLFPTFVIQQDSFLDGSLDDSVGDLGGGSGRRGKPRLYRKGCGYFQNVVGAA